MKIEELTEEMEKAASLSPKPDNSATSPSQAHSLYQPSDATKPSLPPGLAVNAGKSVDEVLKDLNKSPLFMTELEENDDTAALQALAYEGSAWENAADFREHGNECFKVRNYRDASEFYTKAVLVLAAEERKRAKGEVTTDPDGVPDSEEEIGRQKELLEAMYANRGACHLALSNYRSCWLDCMAALRLNPKNVKAYYRSAKALLAVDRIEEADDLCARGLTLDPENKSLLAVADDIVKKATARDAKRKKDAERETTKLRRENLLQAALKARNIPTRSTDQPPDMEDAKIELVPDPDDPRSSLSFPTVLLYPEDLESDFIKAFGETQTLAEHLDYVFPLPWDKDGRYTTAGVECYVETKDGGLLKMGKKVPLLKVLGTGKVEVVDSVVKVFVLPSSKAEAWVKKFKAQKAAARGEPVS